jgi:triosephosphate isomerase
MKKLIAGNWKMNGTLSSAGDLARSLVGGLGKSSDLAEKLDFCVCPPFLHLEKVQGVLAAQGAVALGAQDCALTVNGAYTGDISAEMLLDIGCRYVILGHSERRQYHGETDEMVAAKAAKAHEKGLVAIICVGETEKERESSLAEEVVGGQIRKSLPASANAENTVIAYEPVWAIGTGKTPTAEDVKAMHAFIRGILKEKLDNPDAIRILYGGSVKPENAGVLLNIDNVDGALIGGASLKAEQFLAIAAAAAV